jgi:hypothetical protein
VLAVVSLAKAHLASVFGVVPGAGHSLSRASGFLLGAISITQNSSIPGTAKLETLIGGLMTLALAACVAAVLAGGGLWGFGERRGNFAFAHQGRRLVEGGLIGGVVIGAAVTLVNQATNIGLGF